MPSLGDPLIQKVTGSEQFWQLDPASRQEVMQLVTTMTPDERQKLIDEVRLTPVSPQTMRPSLTQPGALNTPAEMGEGVKDIGKAAAMFTLGKTIPAAGYTLASKSPVATRTMAALGQGAGNYAATRIGQMTGMTQGEPTVLPSTRADWKNLGVGAGTGMLSAMAEYGVHPALATALSQVPGGDKVLETLQSGGMPLSPSQIRTLLAAAQALRRKD